MNIEQIKRELKEYNRLQLEIKRLTAQLKDKKAAIEKGCFAQQTPDAEGTEKVEVAGCIVKRVCKLTRTLTKDSEELEQAIGQLSGTARERLVTFKPSLSVSEYRRLSAADKATIDSVLTVKLAAPTISIEGDFS